MCDSRRPAAACRRGGSDRDGQRGTHPRPVAADPHRSGQNRLLPRDPESALLRPDEDALAPIAIRIEEAEIPVRMHVRGGRHRPLASSRAERVKGPPPPARVVIKSEAAAHAATAAAARRRLHGCVPPPPQAAPGRRGTTNRSRSATRGRAEAHAPAVVAEMHTKDVCDPGPSSSGKPAQAAADRPAEHGKDEGRDGDRHPSPRIDAAGDDEEKMNRLERMGHPQPDRGVVRRPHVATKYTIHSAAAAPGQNGARIRRPRIAQTGDRHRQREETARLRTRGDDPQTQGGDRGRRAVAIREEMQAESEENGADIRQRRHRQPAMPRSS